MTTSAQVEGYIKLDGKFVYCDNDSNKKCLDASKLCSARDGMMSCGNWWGSGYWSGWWNWSYYYGFFGDNLIFLYNEIDAPEEYICGYPRECDIYTAGYSYGWWYGWYGNQLCEQDIGDCNYPRIKNCKTNRCVYDTYTGYYDYYYGYYGYGTACNTISGKDRADRCCKKPEDFQCEEGECDYDYEIVKKTYSIEYELVKPSYFCNDPPPNPTTSCNGTTTTVNDKCYESLSYCGPKNNCPQNYYGDDTDYYWCDPDATKPSKGYSEIAEEVYQTIWDYPPTDCDSPCARCIECSEDDCNFAYYNSYNWGWGSWSYFSNIGSDCCDGGGSYGRPGICPTDIMDDGSGNPWWCTGTDCVQMEEGDETESFTGPFASRLSCIKACNDDTNKCVEPDPNVTTGLCCDKTFMKQLDTALKNECNEQIPNKSQKVKETLCVGTNCQDSAIFTYSKEICGYKSKYSPVTKTVHNKSYKIYEYAIPIPEKNFADACVNYCNQDSYDACRKNFADVWGSNDCPKNTQKAIYTQTTKYNPQEIVGTATVSVIAVFCKVTTKKCVPSEPDPESEE